MNIYTLGAGFVSDHLSYPVISDRIAADEKLINSILDKYKPDVIVNCIGKTGRPNIDWCENNKEITALTNVSLPIMLADSCAKKYIRMIQIGSGCIYFGQSPNKIDDPKYKSALIIGDKPKIDAGWKETDFANPKSFYSKTKYACDLMLGTMPHVTTLRIRMPISTKNNPRNLINKLRGYKQIIDIPNSVTFMDDLTRCVDWAIKSNQNGIFNVTNPIPLSAAQIMKEYQKYDANYTFDIISEEQLERLTLAKRSNCILNTDKLIEAGFSMSLSTESLKTYMAEYIKNI